MCFARATAKSARTSRSPSPIHFDMSDDAEMLKNVARESVAIAFAISVFPVPGGPKSSSPFGGRRWPVKMSGCSSGHTVISRTLCARR